LKSRFPRLFSLSVLKEANICECGSRANGIWEWNLRWRRGLFAWEEDQVRQLLETISNRRIESEIGDKWIWKDSETTIFSVKFVYGLLKGEGGEEDSRLYKSFWRIKALPSAHVTTWRVIENRLAFKVNLERRGIQIESNLCSLCMLSKESTNHLFFDCMVAWLIWNLCYDWLGMNLVDLIVPESHFEHFKFLDAPNLVNLIMGHIWIALVSEI